MDHLFRHRWIAAALGALMVVCAHGVAAQEAPSPAPPERSLPGVADIDFSLDGKEAEQPGTPTEGGPRPRASAAPVNEEAAAPAPSAAATPSVSRTDPDRPQARQPDAGLPAPVTAATDSSAASQDELSLPQVEATGGPDATDLAETAAPADAASTGPVLPAWLLGLGLLAAAVWFAFRRGKSKARAIDSAPVATVKATPVPAPQPSAPAPIPPAPVAQPVAAAPAPAPQPASPAMPEAHPALRVRIREPEPPLEPEPTPPTPAPPPQPAFTRYDAFGRPLVAKPVAPKASPAPPPKPKARIVRYNAMGLPILD
jgi:hypothetical protein